MAVIPQLPFLILASGLIAMPPAYVYAVSALTILAGSLASAVAIKTHGFLGASGVANLGFNLTALGINSIGLLLFNFAYGFALAALCVIISRGDTSNSPLANWRGIKSGEVVLVFTGALLLASLGGVPPLLGFYVKGGLISEGVGAHLILPVLACLLASLPGIVAYLRLALTGLSPIWGPGNSTSLSFLESVVFVAASSLTLGVAGLGVGVQVLISRSCNSSFNRPFGTSSTRAGGLPVSHPPGCSP